MVKKIAPISLMLISMLLTVSLCLTSVYAGDDIELAGNIVLVSLTVAAGGNTLVRDDREGMVQYTKSLLVTLGTTGLLKYTIDAERPNGKSHSFPSAHTSMAFSGATFLQQRYGWSSGAPAFVAASFVGWSRIESDNHYFKDVLAGAVIGVVSTYLLTDRYREKVVVTPFIGEETYGMLLQAVF